MHTYQLLIHLERPRTITVGRLGRHRFPAGYYVYTGSARRNMKARLQRHLRTDKKLRWHIDYLLACPDAQIVDVALFEENECTCNQAVPGQPLAPRFGASDCRRGCGSHLLFVGSGVDTSSGTGNH